MLTDVGGWVTRVAERDPFTNIIGLARSLLALGTLLTLLFNATDTLFRPSAGVPEAVDCTGIGAGGLFCVVPSTEAGRWIGVGILAVVLTGFRPRWTAIPHWYVAFSVQNNVAVTDGGDQVTAVLTLLLIPIALCDDRRNHWDAPGAAEAEAEAALTRRFLANATLTAIRFQVAVLYLHAGAAKFGVREWADGTAMYYWMSDSTFGAPPWLDWLFAPVLAGGATVTFFTWSVALGEIALGASLFLPRRYLRYALAYAVVFHLGIALVMGLLSFAVAMVAADVLYLRPADQPLRPHGSRPLVPARRSHEEIRV